MSTLLKIRKQHPSMMMVILTNNNEYAIQGYKLGILRYIMKEQLEHELPHCMDAVLARYFKHRDVLEMKFVEGKYCVYQDEIVYMESQGHKVNFHLSLGMSVRILTAHTTIDAMQLQLNQNRFVRPHKSFLVNCSYIDKIECGNILLQSGDRITISQSRKKDVDALLTAILWSCIKISRILRNATYMGYLCYNKSKVNNFLEKRRIKNLDEDSFILKKGDFEPIISEALWHQCENIRNGRIRKYQMPSGEERRRGTRIAQNLWVKKLRCRCGAGYNRFKWRVLRDGTPVYGYQCNYRTQNPAKTFVEKNHLDSQKYCDAIVICEWKLDLMAKMIFDQLWGDQREAVLKACQMIESCILSTTLQTDSEKAEKQKKIEKLEQRLLNLGQMRADGELTREQFQKLYAQTTTELDALKTQQNSVPDSAEEEVSFDLNKIKKGLSQMVDITAPRISEELIDEFVEAVTPVENHHYRWKMTFGEMKSGQERYNLMEPENSPVLSFTIDFETARQYRMSNGLPAQFRQRGWTDLNVEVYL